MLTRSKSQAKEKQIPEPKQSFLTSGIRNAGCSCYLNCLLQIFANYTPLFLQISKISPQKELEAKFYLIIQKLMQSKEPISANCFLSVLGRELHINISNQQNFFDVLNDLCRKIPIISELFQFDIDISYFQKKAKKPFQFATDKQFYLINFSESQNRMPALSEIFVFKNIRFDGKICKKIKQMTSLPRILTFSIEYRSYNQTNFAFATKINLKKYCKIATKENFDYELFAILVYISLNPGLGHYVVYIRNFESDQWFEYNDSKVTALKSLKEVNDRMKTSHVSGLFYVNKSIFSNFQKKKRKYENAMNLFCKQTFVEKNDIDNTLVVKDENDKYGNDDASCTSDIAEYEYSYIDTDDDSHSKDGSDGDDDSDSKDGSDGNDGSDSTSFKQHNNDDINSSSSDLDVFSINKENQEDHMQHHSVNFKHGPIDYIDVRPHGNLTEYIKQSPQIPEDEDQRPEPVQVDLSDDHFEEVSEINKKVNKDETTIPKVKEKSKRLYVKTTQAQRDRLQQLYNEHQDTWPTRKYSIETGIREQNCIKLIKKIRHNESLEIKNYLKGRNPKIDAKQIRILQSSIEEDPFMTLKQMQQKLKNESELEVSQTQIWEGIVGNTQVGKRSGCYVYSFKTASKRDPEANSYENKLIRKERVKQLTQCLVEGYEWVCIDETRFDVGYVRVKGWSKKGKKVYIHRKKRGFSCSALTAIGPNGMLYCTLVRGKVTAEIYDAFLDHLAEELKSDGPIVFWMDNASIHNNAQEKFKSSKHKVIFNAPYSPEINPIENIFGVWKEKITKEIVQFKSEAELLDLIKVTFTKIDPATVRKTLENTRWNVFPKVIKLEDL